jgi:glucose-1-phosphate cytidylyltransferase
MKVVILCGGLGTRLRQETEYLPKPMVPIGGRPILWHIMKTYAHYGHKEFIICLGYKGEMIKEYFRNYLWMSSDVTLSLGRKPKLVFHNNHQEEDWQVTLAETGDETATAGRLKKIQPYLGGDKEFLFTYGDGVADVDVNAVIEFHRRSAKLLTLTAVHPPGRFGDLGFEGEALVASFQEKAPAEGGWINGGYFVASHLVLDNLDDCEKIMFEQEPIRALASAKQLAAYRHSGFWRPMDTYQELLQLNKLWDEGRAPWKCW